MTSAPSIKALMAQAGIDPAIHEHISQTVRILVKIADVASRQPVVNTPEALKYFDLCLMYEFVSIITAVGTRSADRALDLLPALFDAIRTSTIAKCEHLEKQHGH